MLAVGFSHRKVGQRLEVGEIRPPLSTRTASSQHSGKRPDLADWFSVLLHLPFFLVLVRFSASILQNCLDPQRRRRTRRKAACIRPSRGRRCTRLKKMIQIRASVTQINLHESGRSWIEVEIDVPGQCERIELDLEELDASAYAPTLLNSPQGLRKLWITQDGPPTINVGETISARFFTKGEAAE